MYGFMAVNVSQKVQAATSRRFRGLGLTKPSLAAVTKEPHQASLEIRLLWVLSIILCCLEVLGLKDV